MAKYFICHVCHHAQIIHFLFCPKWQNVKQVTFIFSQLTSNSLDTFSCPYHFHMPKCNLICLVIISLLFSKVSIQKEALWRRCKLVISKWVAILHDPSYHHIIALHQRRAHVMPPCELTFNSLILSKILVCEASIFYLAPLWLPIFLGLLLSI